MLEAKDTPTLIIYCNRLKVHVMRIIYKNNKTLINNVTQGSIIDHCVAENYKCKVWGVIITPRCDLAHDGKVTHVHYLPIIDFHEWFQIDGLDYLFTKAKLKAEQSLKEECEKNRFPFEKMNQTNLVKMAETIEDKGVKESLHNRINQYFSLLKNNPEVFQPNSSSVKTLIDNLIKNQIPGYHLIEDWEKANSFKVVLLRDLKRLEFNIAKAMGGGIEEKLIKETWKNDLEYSLSKDSLYQVQAEMLSPYVELLMERFSRNFCRVGVDDFDTSISNILINQVSKDE